jgi:transcription elongation factor
MRDFADTMALAAEAAMACLDSETVVYTPRGGDAVSISAVVERMAPGMVGSVGPVPLARLVVRNDATCGIAAASIDTGGDTVAWAPKKGGSTRTSRILQIDPATSAGCTVVMVG